MKLIQPSFSIINQEPGLDGIYKAIESAGRTCYKSEDKITPVSAEEFVNRMIKSGHHAMLEFGTVYLMAETKDFVGPDGHVIYVNSLEKYENNPYSKVEIDVDDNFYITTNYRVLVEHNWLNDLKYLCEPTEYHEKRVCVRFTTDVGVSRELNRHRVNSQAEQSTRYCNFSKDKFGNELSIMIPPEFTEEEINNIFKCRLYSYVDDMYAHKIADWQKLEWWVWANRCCELAYMNLIRLGWKPEQARRILPLDLHTELNHCAFVSDWKHFFELRCSPNAHPQARELAIPLQEEFIARGYINN